MHYDDAGNIRSRGTIRSTESLKISGSISTLWIVRRTGSTRSIGMIRFPEHITSSSS